jgi:hypothetical protein
MGKDEGCAMKTLMVIACSIPSSLFLFSWFVHVGVTVDVARYCEGLFMETATNYRRAADISENDMNLAIWVIDQRKKG